MCEGFATKMGNIRACRVCFISGVKLYNMFKYNLQIIYENLTGLSVSKLDKNPHYMCVNCQHILVKSYSFKEMCIRAQDILESGTTDVKTLPAKRHIAPVCLSNSSMSLVVINPDEEPVTVEVSESKIKEEYVDHCEENIVKKIKKEENIPATFEYGDDAFTVAQNVEYSEFESDNIEDSKEYTEFDSMEIVEYEPNAAEQENEMDAELNKSVEIIVLSKEQQLEEIMARKEMVNYQKSYYKCDLCYKGFMTDATFRNHMAKHDPSAGIHKCDICHTRWPNKRTLKAHTSTAHEKKYVCKLCSYVSRSCHKAKEHIKWHQGYNYVCKICGATFSKSTSHLTHLRLQHPSKFCCEYCGESFISENGLNIHKKKAHTQNEGTPIKLQFICLVCKTNFKTMDALTSHNDISNNETCDPDLSYCPQCGENFESQELLKVHQKSHKQELIKCDDCHRTFTKERSLAVHYQRVHLGIKFKSKPQDGKNSTVVVCEVCGKECKSNSLLVCHQRIHTGEKPYPCSECPKRFSVQQRLQLHMRTHTGERPYNCAHCPKAFKHKAALNRHNRVHTGDKPYQCPHCLKAFSQSNSMKLHVNTVHLKMPAPYKSKRNKHHED